MGGSHAHGSTHDDDVEVSGLARTVLVVALALAGLASVVGMALLWPSAADAPEPVEFAQEGVTFPTAEVRSVGEPCPVVRADPNAPPPAGEEGGDEPFPEGCNVLEVTVADGDGAGDDVSLQVPPYVTRAGLVPGDDVQLIRIPTPGGAPDAGAGSGQDGPATGSGLSPDGDASYGWSKVERDPPLLALGIAFLVVVVAVARLRGVLAMVGLGFAGLVVAFFMLPALLAGGNGLAVALVGSSVIMFVVLYLAHGLSVRTSTALAGTLVGIAITTVIALWGVDSARLSGVSDDTGELLLLYADGLDYQGLLTSAIIIAGLGVLNDVTITQSSAVWELRSAAPEMSRTRLFASGMRIGRDHIASTIYTIVFVYVGSALAVLMLTSLYERPLTEVLTDEVVAEEIVRTLASAIGLVLAVPVTTGIAALTVRPERPRPGRRARTSPAPEPPSDAPPTGTATPPGSGRRVTPGRAASDPSPR
ncbi:YibE/F family protein [Nocardioides sp. CFH 31398]|uniref:YibE/F family protein n=1 Tax=Nocardioides sp. CFH 31398 TaxID=2919579 RepID=UPI001F0632B8|nr:YibE/F family protein [Nocardioides sp. CFH 31398]MCH1866063.1 YibE/F family protein [Nocardioides sp. CFH 31398]